MVTTRRKQYATTKSDSKSVRARAHHKQVMSQMMKNKGNHLHGIDLAFDDVYKPAKSHTFHYTNPIAGKTQKTAYQPEQIGNTPMRVRIMRRHLNEMVKHKLSRQKQNLTCGKNKESVKNGDGSYSCKVICKDGYFRNPKSNRCVLQKTCKRSHRMDNNNRCKLRSRAELAAIVNSMQQ